MNAITIDKKYFTSLYDVNGRNKVSLERSLETLENHSLTYIVENFELLYELLGDILIECNLEELLV